MDKYGLSGKVALVTGATSGIGSNVARRLAEAGVKVLAAGRDPQRGAAVTEPLRAAGAIIDFVTCDLRDPTQCARMLDRCVKQHGRLDIAFNNAGVSFAGTLLHEGTIEEWHETISINLTSVWLCMKSELDVMVRQHSGAIVNTSSIAGLVGYSRAAAYAASKHGVIGLTRTAAIDYAPFGIRVNAVCPGPVQTPMLEKALTTRGPSAREKSLGNIPLHRFAAVDDVTEAVLWLASDQAAFVTGHALAVDGGWTAR